MKTLLISTVLVIALAAGAGEIIVSIPINASAINISEAGIYTRITGTGMGLINNIGEPSLPAYTETIALPTGCMATEIEIINDEFNCVRGRHNVMPEQTPVPFSVEWDVAPVQPDPAIYNSNSFYPSNSVEFAGSSVILGIPVAYVKVFPARWNPISRTVDILTDLKLRVTYESSPEASTVSRRSIQSELRSQEIIRNTVANPEGVSCSGAAIVDSKDLTYGEYVIITIDAYESYAQELADWKTSKGVPANVYTTTWINNNYSCYDLQQEIRAFLTDCRDEGVEYVLIYGDDNVVTGRDVLITLGTVEEYPPVDLYWSDINDMIPGADLWDSNNNHIWGEFEDDNVDYHPDLWTGRASVNSTDECTIFNEKVFVYEGVSSTDYFESSEIEERIGYTTEMLWPGCYGSAGAELISPYVPSEWEEEKCYDSNANNSFAITDSMLNAGPHHVYHASHGGPTGFSLPGGSYSVSDFKNLTNISSGGLPAIWNSISCLIGHLDLYECMGDAWNNSPEGGGFGAFNARYGLGNPGNPGYGVSEVLSRYFYDVMWNDDLYILGVAHAMGNDAMCWPNGEAEDWCVKGYNLFGDPELPMWSRDVSILEAVHTTSISGATNLTVAVSSGGSPVSGARICLQKGDWQTGDIYEVDTANSAGECTFYVNPSSTGTISVVAWARDCVSYQGTITVTGTGFEGGDLQEYINGINAVYPSPAINSVTIPFSIATDGMTRIDVYDISGRVAATIEADEMTAGEHSVQWELADTDGNPVPAGVYCVRISTPEWTGTSNMVVVR
ncbi:MAG: T9SS type A sorting domain-containing protein [Candidatus Aegiribacteria sp.]|nr:T9SS type A sorting domain-containing protein [Candidatus Aegiribacteria sp.]